MGGTASTVIGNCSSGEIKVSVETERAYGNELNIRAGIKGVEAGFEYQQEWDKIETEGFSLVQPGDTLRFDAHGDSGEVFVTVELEDGKIIASKHPLEAGRPMKVDENSAFCNWDDMPPEYE